MFMFMFMFHLDTLDTLLLWLLIFWLLHDMVVECLIFGFSLYLSWLMLTLFIKFIHDMALLFGLCLLFDITKRGRSLVLNGVK